MPFTFSFEAQSYKDTKVCNLRRGIVKSTVVSKYDMSVRTN
jgi:hypothetical protein